MYAQIQFEPCLKYNYAKYFYRCCSISLELDVTVSAEINRKQTSGLATPRLPYDVIVLYGLLRIVVPIGAIYRLVANASDNGNYTDTLARGFRLTGQ